MPGLAPELSICHWLGWSPSCLFELAVWSARSQEGATVGRTSPTGGVVLRVGLLSVISSLKLEARDKSPILEEFPRLKSRWLVPKQVMEATAWSDSWSQDIEPKHSGLDVGRGKGFTEKWGTEKGAMVDGAKWHRLCICALIRLQNVLSSVVRKRKMGETEIAINRNKQVNCGVF